MRRVVSIKSSAMLIIIIIQCAILLCRFCSLFNRPIGMQMLAVAVSNLNEGGGTCRSHVVTVAFCGSKLSSSALASLRSEHNLGSVPAQWTCQCQLVERKVNNNSQWQPRHSHVRHTHRPLTVENCTARLHCWLQNIICHQATTESMSARIIFTGPAVRQM